MTEQEYQALKAIEHFLLTREYKPEEFGAFGAAGAYVGDKLREWEDGQEADSADKDGQSPDKG